MTDEELKSFKAIPGYPGYRINDKGKVYSDKRRIVIATQPADCYWPYDHVMLCIGGKFKPQSIHKLLALAFIPLPNGYTYDGILNNYRKRTLVVDHIDGNKLNNDLTNLRWLTDHENLTVNTISKQNRKTALRGNNNATGHKFNSSSKKRYIYYYNGNEYSSLAKVAEAIGTTPSVISEAFRRNLYLVREGVITRIEKK